MTLTHLIEKPVLVRANLAGVYLGILLAAEPDGTLRLRARRLWSWIGALDSTTLAAIGPTGGRIGPESDVVLAPAAAVIEVVKATEEAMVALSKVRAWER